jgi:hypothetical protein
MERANDEELRGGSRCDEVDEPVSVPRMENTGVWTSTNMGSGSAWRSMNTGSSGV